MAEFQSEVERAASEKARLLDLTNDAILVRDASDRITFWNRAAAEMYGYNFEQAVGRVSHALLRTDFPEPLEQINKKLLREGRWIGELKHIAASGQSVTVSTQWIADRNERGEIVSILETNRDISDLKRVQEVQSRLAAIVESSDDAIVSKNLEGVITSWNCGAERIFGYTAAEAIGQHITLIVPSNRLEEENDILRRIRNGQRIDHFETVRRRKDGTLLEVSVTISPVVDAHGRVTGASKVARDITERKKIERLVREAEFSGRLLLLQDAEKRRLARELHDGVGQLLAAIKINDSRVAIEKAALSPAAAKRVEENCSLIDRAISEIRTVSHLLHPPFLEEVGLCAVLSDYVHGFIERSNIQVSLELPSDLGRLAQDVELSLFRIVQECMTNIYRHSTSATALVRLQKRSGEIELEVSDCGRGIPSEIQEKLSAGLSGGVGLRGMQERVRQLGGRLRIQSNQMGTSVIVELPVGDDTIATDERFIAMPKAPPRRMVGSKSRVAGPNSRKQAT